MINKSNIYIYIGAFISQIVTLFVSLIVLKYIAPKTYGEFSYIVAIGSVIGSIVTLKFEQAITISENEEKSLDKLIITLQTSFVLTLLSLPFIYFFGNVSPLQVLFIFLISFSIGANASLQQFYLFTNKHKLNALLSVSISILNLFFLYFIYKYNQGLLYAYAFSYFIATGVFLIYTYFNISKYSLLSVKKYKEIFYENISFPKHVLPSALITIFLLYGNPIILKYIFSEHEVGVFMFSMRILMLPVILVSAVSSGIFKAKMSKLYIGKEESLFNKEKKKMLLFLFLSMVVLYPILLVAIFNINYFFDASKWVELKLVSIYLVFYVCAQFVYIPFSNLPLILNKSKLILSSNIFLLLILLSIYLFTYILKINLNTFLLMFTISNVLFSIYYIAVFYNLKFSKN